MQYRTCLAAIAFCIALVELWRVFLLSPSGKLSLVLSPDITGVNTVTYMPDLPEDIGAQCVIILAQMRTGSTLLGQILNRHPNMFYLFEPLHLNQCIKEKNLTLGDYENTTSKLLSEICQCRFSDVVAQCLTSFGQDQSFHLYEALVALRRTKTPAEILQETCLQYKGRIGIKLIRASLKEMEEVVAASNNTAKIIHLVRDPRGVAHSQRLFNTPQEQLMKLHVFEQYLRRGGWFIKEPSDIIRRIYKADIKNLCPQMREDLELVMKGLDWVKNSYKLVRYEDFANEPVKMTKKIYNFIGVNPPKQVIDYIRKYTNVSTLNDMGGNMAIRKNSSATASKWRRYITKEELDMVQGECFDVLQLLGYKLFKTQNDLVNLTDNALLPLGED